MSQPAIEFDLNEEFPHLPGAPIVEAVIDLRARADDSLAVKDLQAKLTEQLPDYPDAAPQHELQLAAHFDTDGPRMHQQESWRGVRLTSSDKRQIAQFNRDGFVFSRLQPYQCWDDFESEALRLWQLFVDLANPSDVQRAGLRFINRVTPIQLDSLSRYLDDPPRCLSALELPPNGFFHQTTHDVPGHPIQIRVVQTLQPPSPQHPNAFGLILDIDVATTQAFLVSDVTLKDYLSKMRWLKNKAFLSLITDEAITEFQQVQQ